VGEFHDRLMDRARALGTRQVRIEHDGSRGSPRRFHRHPHLTGDIINGRTFKYPVTARPRDASRDYRRSSLRGLEEHLRAVDRLPSCDRRGVSKKWQRPCPD
jgi:hypothetical protein